MVDSGADSAWQNVDEMLVRWLAERRELLVQYCRVGDELKDGNGSPPWRLVSSFLQVLVDYVSAGHFEVYQQLVAEAAAYGEDSSELVNALFGPISQTTESALALSEKYGSEELWEQHQQDIAGDVSRIGEEISTRFELEDRLVTNLHERHRPGSTS